MNTKTEKLAERILQAIDKGVDSGYASALKKSDDSFYVRETIKACIQDELFDIIDFDDIDEEDTDYDLEVVVGV